MNKYEKIERQTNFFLNTVMGFISFNFGLACLGTEHPSRYAWVSIVFTTGIAIVYSKKNSSAQEMKRLRQKENKTRREKEFIQYIDIHMDKLNYRFIKYVVKKMPIYLLGTVFLTCVALGILK